MLLENLPICSCLNKNSILNLENLYVSLHKALIPTSKCHISFLCQKKYINITYGSPRNGFISCYQIWGSHGKFQPTTPLLVNFFSEFLCIKYERIRDSENQHNRIFKQCFELNACTWIIWRTIFSVMSKFWEMLFRRKI